jgi:hypothetical protein
MKKVRLLPWFLLSLVFVSCVGGGRINPSKLSNISVGMTKTEVISILGKPHSAGGSKHVEVLGYREDHGMWVFTPYYVRLVEGKVESYGKNEPKHDIDANVDPSVQQK